MRKVIIATLICLDIFMGSIPLWADDGSVERLGPQLQFDPPSFLSVELLSIDLSYSSMSGQVEVTYIIRNNSEHDWSGQLNFNIPEREWYGYGSWYVDRGFSDMVVFVNGERIIYKSHNVAYIDNQDVSDILAKAGLDFDFVDLDESEIPSIPATPENKKKYQKLQERGIVHGNPAPKDADESFWFEPAWSLISNYYWKQKFPANSLTEIKYKYEPLPGVDNIGLDYLEIAPYFLQNSGYKNLEELLGMVCISIDSLEILLPSKQQQRFYNMKWFTFRIDKIHWSALIHQLKVKVHGYDNERDYGLFSCISGKKIYGGRTVEMLLENVSINDPIVFLMAFPYGENF